MRQHPLEVLGAPMPRHGFCAAMSMDGQLVNRGPCGKGDHSAHVWPRLPSAYANLFPEHEVWSYPENAVREKVR